MKSLQSPFSRGALLGRRAPQPRMAQQRGQQAPLFSFFEVPRTRGAACACATTTDLLDLFVRDRARGARTGLVEQSVQAPLNEAAAPLRNGLLVDAGRGRDLVVVETLRAAQDDPAAQREPLLRLWPARPALQLPTLRRLQDQVRLRSPDPRHLRLLVGCRRRPSTASILLPLTSEAEH